MNQFPHHSASPLLLHQKRSVYPCAVMCRWCLTIRSFLAEIEIPLNPVSKTHEGDHFNRPFYIFLTLIRRSLASMVALDVQGFERLYRLSLSPVIRG